jgi:hypothetical protein
MVLLRLHFLQLLVLRSGNHLIDCDLFKASRDKVLQIKIHNREGVLAVKGVRAAKIDFTTDLFQNRHFTMDEEDLAKEPICELYDALRILNLSYPTKEQFPLAFMMATICGKTMMLKSAARDAQLTCSFFAYLHYSFLMHLCYDDLKRQDALDKDLLNEWSIS